MDKLVIASYNIRYARGPYLISGGLRRKMGLMSLTRRSEHVARQISAAAQAFSDGVLLPRVDVLALQEADICTRRTGGHHVAKELAAELGMTMMHEAAGIPRGVAPVKRQWWLDFEEPIDLHDSGDTGVALLSRLPLIRRDAHRSAVARVSMASAAGDCGDDRSWITSTSTLQRARRSARGHQWSTGPTRSGCGAS